MKAKRTGFVNHVATMGQQLKAGLIRTWYQVTALYPRLLPENPKELDHLKKILIQNFGVKDDPRVWCTVFGEICSVQRISMRKPYKHYVNVAKRLDVNLHANTAKALAIQDLQVTLQKKMEEMGNGDELPSGTPDNATPLQALSPIEEDLVPIS